MTLRRRDRQTSLTPWSVVLTVLLAFAGAVLEIGATTGSPAEVAAVERGIVASSSGVVDPARVEDFDPVQHAGYLTGPDAASRCCADTACARTTWLAARTFASQPIRPAPARDGLSRAPPVA